MRSHTGRLLLTMQDPFHQSDRSLLESCLVAGGFLGRPLTGRMGAFLVGDRFLHLVTFAGCSVQVALSPTGDGPFCHIRIRGPFERPLGIKGRNTRPPRCPFCRNPLQDWKQPLEMWDSGEPADIPCPACGQVNPLWAYDWKKKAGFGRLFVQVEEIFPGEAVPTPDLMRLLENSTRSEWRYFYIQDG